MGKISRSRFGRVNPRHLLPDLVLLTISMYGSLFLRVSGSEVGPFLTVLNRNLILFLAIKVATFVALGVYDIIWRYISMNDAAKLFGALTLGSTFTMAGTFLVDIGRIPRATFLIDLILSFCLLAGIRFSRRLVFDYSARKGTRNHGKRVLIYGAGHSGRAMAQRLNIDTSATFNLVGFVDDNPEKINRVIAGVKVLGGHRQLADLIRAFDIEEVLVAVTSPSSDLLRRIVETCRAFEIRPRLVGSPESLESKKTIEAARPIELSDLLHRNVRNLHFPEVAKLLAGKRVLVTGAGGSIGSELVRQILAHGPRRLMLLDHSEFNLYRIDDEIRFATSANSTVIPLLADVTNESQMEQIFEAHRPEIVFHAAAYKHVHLVEANANAAILNNVLGTKIVVELSGRYGIENFVLVSTDKAVNPVGVMGATKRVCELIVADVGMRTGKNYCAVRFGNVLGSSGSLIPLLQKQIENGEPVTITHRETTRYFMLIPEAVSLVLGAAAISEPADVMILRMGDPVRILDVARSLLTLMGRDPEKYPVVFTGLRPGEKLHEELYLTGLEHETEYQDILVLPNGDGADNLENLLAGTVATLIDAAKAGHADAVYVLWKLVRSGPNLKPEPRRAPSPQAERPPELLN